MQTRSAIALGTLILLIGLIYFGRLLPDGSAESSARHPHQDVACRQCHAYFKTAVQEAEPRGRSQDCLGCHREAAEKSRLFHSDLAENCGKCHLFHAPELLLISDDTLSLSFAQTATQLCRDCHSDGTRPAISLGHRDAARLIHSQRDLAFAEQPSQFCLSCHDADRRNAVVDFAGGGLPRFHVSASHAFGIPLVAGFRKPSSSLKINSDIPEFLVLIDGNIECQTCHSLVSENEFLLARQISDGMCTDCHDMARVSGDSPILTVKP